MSEKRTTAKAFHDAVGVEDWRVLFSGAHAYFRVGSFAEAAKFVAAIAEAAEVVGHLPDVHRHADPLVELQAAESIVRQ
jgi:4a-hydroxytetrahydrobiopterin dehydratase